MTKLTRMSSSVCTEIYTEIWQASLANGVRNGRLRLSTLIMTDKKLERISSTSRWLPSMTKRTPGQTQLNQRCIKSSSFALCACVRVKERERERHICVQHTGEEKCVCVCETETGRGCWDVCSADRDQQRGQTAAVSGLSPDDPLRQTPTELTHTTSRVPGRVSTHTHTHTPHTSRAVSSSSFSSLFPLFCHRSMLSPRCAPCALWVRSCCFRLTWRPSVSFPTFTVVLVCSRNLLNCVFSLFVFVSLKCVECVCVCVGRGGGWGGWAEKCLMHIHIHTQKQKHTHTH